MAAKATSSSSGAAAAPEGGAAAKPAKPRGRRKAAPKPGADAPAPSVPDEALALGDCDASLAGAARPMARGRSKQGAGPGVARCKASSNKGGAANCSVAVTDENIVGAANAEVAHAAASNAFPAVAVPMVGGLATGDSAAVCSLASLTPSRLQDPSQHSGSPADLPWPPAEDAWCYEASPAEETSSPQPLPDSLSGIPEQQPSPSCSPACATGSTAEELRLREPPAHGILALERGCGVGTSGNDPDTVVLLSSSCSESEAEAPAAVLCAGLPPAGRGAACIAHKRCR